MSGDYEQAKLRAWQSEGAYVTMRPLASSWEQRKLGELMDVTSVRRVHQEDWTDEGVRFLRARDLVAFARNEPIDDPLFISEEMYQEYSAQSGKVSVGDLLVTGVGTIGVPWLVTSENPIYFKDGNIIWFKNAGEIDGEFFSIVSLRAPSKATSMRLPASEPLALTLSTRERRRQSGCQQNKNNAA